MMGPHSKNTGPPSLIEGQLFSSCESGDYVGRHVGGRSSRLLEPYPPLLGQGRWQRAHSSGLISAAPFALEASKYIRTCLWGLLLGHRQSRCPAVQFRLLSTTRQSDLAGYCHFSRGCGRCTLGRVSSLCNPCSSLLRQCWLSILGTSCLVVLLPCLP